MVKIRFTAKSDRAEALFRLYKDTPAKEIKSILTVSEKPLIIDVEPRLNGLQRQGLVRALRNPVLRRGVVAEMEGQYAKAMKAEGLKVDDYGIEVRA